MYFKQMAMHELKLKPIQKYVQRDQWILFICKLCDTLETQTVSQGTNKHVQTGNLHTGTEYMRGTKI